MDSTGHQDTTKEVEMSLEWTKDLDQALERGRAERKPVFLYFAKDP